MKRAGQFLVDAWTVTEQQIVLCMTIYGAAVVRILLAVLFIWSGMLKIVDQSPVGEMLARTVPWISPNICIPMLGIWEVLVGTGLLFRVALRLTLALLGLQMAGVLLALVLHADVMLQHGNPLLLTLDGEFVVKQLVLIAVGMVIGSTSQR